MDDAKNCRSIAIAIDSHVDIARRRLLHRLGQDGGSKTTPSIVGRNKKGELLAGEPARALQPCIRQVKRIIGLHVDHPIAKKQAEKFAYIVADDAGMAAVKIGDTLLSPEEVTATILAKLKALAEDRTGISHAACIITVPAYFPTGRRLAVIKAGYKAGFKKVILVNEPTAAILAHLFINGVTEGKFLVFDLGGGTFDVTAAYINTARLIRVKATAGDPCLGGDDITDALLNYVLSAVGQERAGNLTPKQKERVRISVEAAKMLLSDAEDAQVELDDGDDDVTIDRAILKDIATPLLERTLKLMAEVLDSVGWLKEELEAVVLVGGATESPMVADMLREEGYLVSGALNPRESVVYGAGLYAAMKQGIAGARLSDLLVHDVIAMSIGIRQGEQFTRVLRKNGQMPGFNYAKGLVVPRGAKELVIEILEGESAEADANYSLGSILVKVAPGTTHIDLRLYMDANACLHIKAFDRSQGCACQLEQSGDWLDESLVKLECEDGEVDDMDAAEDSIVYLSEGEASSSSSSSGAPTRRRPSSPSPPRRQAEPRGRAPLKENRCKPPQKRRREDDSSADSGSENNDQSRQKPQASTSAAAAAPTNRRSATTRRQQPKKKTTAAKKKLTEKATATVIKRLVGVNEAAQQGLDARRARRAEKKALDNNAKDSPLRIDEEDEASEKSSSGAEEEADEGDECYVSSEGSPRNDLLNWHRPLTEEEKRNTSQRRTRGRTPEGKRLDTAYARIKRKEYEKKIDAQYTEKDAEKAKKRAAEHPATRPGPSSRLQHCMGAPPMPPTIQPPIGTSTATDTQLEQLRRVLSTMPPLPASRNLNPQPVPTQRERDAESAKRWAEQERRNNEEITEEMAAEYMAAAQRVPKKK